MNKDESKNKKMLYEGKVNRITPTLVFVEFPTLPDYTGLYNYRYDKTIYKDMNEVKKVFPKARKGRIFY